MEMYFVYKTAHIVSVVAWFAALFYVPRLFVYQLEAPQAAPTLHLMAGRLIKVIMRPAAAATWLFGLLLILNQPHLMHMGWLHAKLGLVLLLTAYHGSLEAFHGGFRRGTNTRTAKFYRMYNEVPTLLLITIVGLAVFKPF